MLSACTDDSEHKQPPEQVQQLKEVVSSGSIEIANRITYWLSKRSKEPSVRVKLKTIKLISDLLDSGNPNYQLATKRNCLDDLEVAKVFTVDPDPTHGDKPRDMVREKASVLADRLAAAPDEAREMLMEAATIPAEGTVRSGFEVAKPGTLVMVFDNTVRLAVAVS
jgi:septum formation inhibitor MinC